MNTGFFYFFLLFITCSFLVMKPAVVFAAETQCKTVTVQTPPIVVAPTGFDAQTGQDAVEGKKENKFANYYQGLKTEKDPATEKIVNKPAIVPKRSIVVVSDGYRDLIEETGKFSKYKGEAWVPVQVVSVPPENRNLQKAALASTKAIAKYQYPEKSEDVSVGDKGYMKLDDLEKIEKQKDYTFVVKKDSPIFTSLNKYINQNNYKAFEPFALKLKRTLYGYEVKRCCNSDNSSCTNYPIFQLLDVTDDDGTPLEVPVELKCFLCQKDFTKDLVPIEDHFLKPIQNILAHPTLGLDNSSNEIKKAHSIAELDFVDSRGFVQIPIEGSGAVKSGPFNSRHYNSESGDADVYMKPDVACGFMQFLKTWDQTCKGRDDCAIEFGDASHANHKNCIKKNGKCSDPWVHQSHTQGECLDINTSRMADKHLAPMMKMLKNLGPQNCLTMEGRISAQGCGYDKTGVHDTHMHVCFPSNDGAVKNYPNKKLKESCEQGVK